MHEQRSCILRRQVSIDDHNYSFRESPREGHFDLRDIHAAGDSFRGEPPSIPVSSLRLLTALSCDNTFIGRIGGDLNAVLINLRGCAMDKARGFVHHESAYPSHPPMNPEPPAPAPDPAPEWSEKSPPPALPGPLPDISPRRPRDHARLDAPLRPLQMQKFHALNELAGGVAHEFNNIVAGILGSAELLKMDLPEGHPAEESLKQIFEACNQARDLLHKLRDLGQRLPPDLKPIRLQPVIEECLQILRSIVPPKVELEAVVAADCACVAADPAQIHQAVFDLCLFCWQRLADHRGHIKLSLENCSAAQVPPGAVSVLPPGPCVRLTVQDNGPGLDQNTRERIFHPFRNRRAGGTKVGLELFLVREIIQAHSGEIFLDSERGSGLTFYLYLPAVAEGR